MARNQEARLLLGCIALALMVLTGLALNVARLGPVISREIQRAQIDYIQEAGTGTAVETNALLLGQCLQREMVRGAHAGFVYSDTWAVSMRVHALPECRRALPALPPSVLRASRVQPMFASMHRARVASSVAAAAERAD